MQSITNINGRIRMTPKQLDVIKMNLNPTKKLFLIAMLEAPNANRKKLAELLNTDATHVSTVTKKMVNDGLIETYKIPDSVSLRYVVKI